MMIANISGNLKFWYHICDMSYILAESRIWIQRKIRGRRLNEYWSFKSDRHYIRTVHFYRWYVQRISYPSVYAGCLSGHITDVRPWLLGRHPGELSLRFYKHLCQLFPAVLLQCFVCKASGWYRRGAVHCLQDGPCCEEISGKREDRRGSLCCCDPGNPDSGRCQSLRSDLHGRYHRLCHV